MAGRSALSLFRIARRKLFNPKFASMWEAGSVLYTDALLSYEELATDCSHQVVDHAVQYVDGNVHTNTLENF